MKKWSHAGLKTRTGSIFVVKNSLSTLRPAIPPHLRSGETASVKKAANGCYRVTIQAGVSSQTVKSKDFQSVTVDSTVQEKTITYPTDGKLIERCRQHMVRLAEKHRLNLRQNYNRKAPYLLMMSHRYSHAK